MIKRWGWPIDRLDYDRFLHLPKIIRQTNSKVIIEIGVCGGYHAMKMILTALETPGRVQYYGFDLFEDATKEILENEASPKPLDMVQVHSRLTGIGVDVELFKGFTRDTLPEFVKRNIKPDFVFIDGGHSFRTVANDWDCVQQMMHPKTVVVFDDYLSAFKELGWGCNWVVDSLKGYDVELLEPPDKYQMKRSGSDERFFTENRFAKVSYG